MEIDTASEELWGHLHNPFALLNLSRKDTNNNPASACIIYVFKTRINVEKKEIETIFSKVQNEGYQLFR